MANGQDHLVALNSQPSGSGFDLPLSSSLTADPFKQDALNPKPLNDRDHLFTLHFFVVLNVCHTTGKKRNFKSSITLNLYTPS